MRTGLLVVAASAAVLVAVHAGAVPAGRDLTWPGGGEGRVVFEGSEHAEKGYQCDACHPALFQTRKGAAVMSMAAMNEGKFCGACHNGKTAFGTSDPKECHECHRKKARRGKHNGHEKHDRDD